MKASGEFRTSGCSGKTELLSDLAHQISLSDPNANIIRAELRDSPELRDYGALHSFAEESFLEGKENCLLIDDADLCPSVELALASLHAMGKFDIYITCSGDFLSLSPLGTLLTGRTFDIPVFPFSLSEFLEQSGSPDRYGPSGNICSGAGCRAHASAGAVRSGSAVSGKRFWRASSAI